MHNVILTVIKKILIVNQSMRCKKSTINNHS